MVIKAEGKGGKSKTERRGGRGGGARVVRDKGTKRQALVHEDKGALAAVAGLDRLDHLTNRTKICDS